MKRTTTPAETLCPKLLAACLSSAWVMKLLCLLILVALPAAVQAQFTYTTNDSTITITGYAGPGPGGAVDIPSTIKGLPVTTIGDLAFGGKAALSSVTIPNSVTNIGEFAFLGCTSLTTVVVPSSVTTIGYDAFGNCTSLNAITVAVLNASYSSMDGVLFDRNQTTLIHCPARKSGSYTIPNSVISLEDSAFDRCISLTSVTIPDSVSNIGGWAFFECARLTSVTIPNSVTSFGNSVFAGCTKLTNVTIGNSVATIGAWAFGGCTSLTGVYFRRGASSDYDESMFDGADQVTVYYLPGTTGWGTTFADRPTALWSLPYPVILSSGPGFGAAANGFGFLISWATNASVVVEASPSLAMPIWTPVSTNTLTAGTSQFTDPQWTNYPARLYRLVTP